MKKIFQVGGEAKMLIILYLYQSKQLQYKVIQMKLKESVVVCTRLTMGQSQTMAVSTTDINDLGDTEFLNEPRPQRGGVR